LSVIPGPENVCISSSGVPANATSPSFSQYCAARPLKDTIGRELANVKTLLLLDTLVAVIILPAAVVPVVPPLPLSSH